MIGKVTKGASFFHCISYCLEDKIELTEAMKQQLTRTDNLQHNDRAEVLEYNKCFGDKFELAEQFRDVQKLSKWVEKPVLHLSFRLAPGDSLTRNQFIEIGREAAKEFGVVDHQYICILHRDTNQEHIHIVANRVGFDGKVAKDGNSYKRMATLCRRLERQYNLQQVLSPRAFLSPEDRLLPRHDIRIFQEKLTDDAKKVFDIMPVTLINLDLLFFLSIRKINFVELKEFIIHYWNIIDARMRKYQKTGLSGDFLPSLASFDEIFHTIMAENLKGRLPADPMTVLLKLGNITQERLDAEI
jgi:hypothetical protein